MLEMLHRLKFLQIEEFTLEQTEEILNDSIVQAVSFTAHALPDTFLFEHGLVQLVPVLPALI